MPTYQDLFESVIGVEPPQRLDVDEMMSRSRRRLARRRAAGVVAVSLAVVVVAVGVTAVTGRLSLGQERIGDAADPDRHRDHPAPAPTAEDPVGRTSAHRVGVGGCHPASGRDAGRRAERCARVVSCCRTNPSGSDFPFQMPPSGRGEPVLPYRGYASLQIDGRAGHPILFIEVGVIGSVERPSCAGKPDCVESTGPRGERIVTLTETITKDSDDSASAGHPGCARVHPHGLGGAFGR